MKNYRYNQQGVTLLLGLLVLSSIMAISFSLATILLVEVRSSSDLLKTEPAIYGAESITEEAIYKIKREVPDNLFSYPANIGNIQLNNPPPSESATTTPIYQIVVLPHTNFSNTGNHYILAPRGSTAGSNYSKIKLTFLDNGNPSALTAYVCQYDPSLPYDPSHSPSNSYSTVVCSNPNDTENGYWIYPIDSYQTQPSGKGVSLTLLGHNTNTWNLVPNKQQEIILYNDDPSTSASNIYVQIEGFDASGSPAGIPYLNKKSVDINADNNGIHRKIRAEVPN